MKVPSAIQWIVRRAHNGLNRWTLNVATGHKSDLGWSAWSWKYRNTHMGRFMMRLINALFWRGHCQNDYNRIMDGQPLVIDWRTVRAFCRVMVLLLALPALLVWWMI